MAPPSAVNDSVSRSQNQQLAAMARDVGADAVWLGMESDGQPVLVGSYGTVVDILETWAELIDEAPDGDATFWRHPRGIRVLLSRTSVRAGTGLWLGLSGLDPENGSHATKVARDFLHRWRSDLESQRGEVVEVEFGGRRFPDDFLPPGIVPCVSSAMTRLYEGLSVAARGRGPILLQGETGVGKEHLARLVHNASTAAENALVAINCAAVPAELLEAELFGIHQGVASGVRARDGLIRRAHRGTLFLDEIGEMSPALQSKLLRFLQEGEVHPVGGTPVKVDVRVVSATNLDIERGLGDGRLRADLYYRLSGQSFRVPPLRERRDDIPRLVQHFQAQVSGRGHVSCGVTVRALQRLLDHAWPGNVRQLAHEVERAALRSPPGAAIGESALSPGILGTPKGMATKSCDRSAGLKTRLLEVERDLIEQALETSPSISGAARRLGISRNGLKQKCRRLGICLGSMDGSGDDAQAAPVSQAAPSAPSALAAQAAQAAQAAK